ncbi:NAD(P)/FAD-dependent oxidoreductase [Exilibacterium tricleocarpae]|uniref:Pyridine nucleotide-disulfide oxidoreductase domain-containing protein 2 n=1 Tax=Exilibacterium tricleocarpae TaxID=2591008 RepID=A0A545TSA6_9GAMM|nr:NAD(P)/FAD-dependent oxidoreductase [Exilibacterium tricleocarpae]TQV80107.1 NAD(P)/FAD-dependent oxidoreductase [Exilibacterium tricleocarpae]
MATDCDVLIIGGGHNGLVCAAYLAAGGLKVKVLERRALVGGAAVTEEFHPGFRNSVASYTVSLLNPKVIDDLQLYQHGLQVLLRPLSNFFLLSPTENLSFGAGREADYAAIAALSAHDADQLAPYQQMLDGVVDALRGELLRTPPNIGGGLADLMRAGGLGRRLRKLPMARRRDLLDMFTKSAAAILDTWFEHENVKAVFAFDATVGNFTSPYAPGSAYVLLHHVFGEANGVRGAWGHAVGGMGAITQAMLKVARARGVEVETEAEVAEVLVHNRVATGVRLVGGSTVRARAVVANVGPKLLYLRLINERELAPELVRRLRGYRSGSGTFRMNVALSALPEFRSRPGSGVHHSAGIVIAPTMDYMDCAYTDARRYGWSKAPIVEMLIPSTVDDSLAPPGQHVASLFCQQFRPHLAGGASWDRHREAAAETIIDTVTRYAPNFRDSIIATQIHSPLDLERKFGLVDGDIFHGCMGLDQIYSNRPLLGYANYRTPIGNLYLCGSGAHPGGGVTGIPGHNAAREVLGDFRKQRLRL